MSISGIGGSDWPISVTANDKNRQKLQGNSGLVGAEANIDPANLIAPTTSADDPVAQFTDYMKMTPEQRMQAAWLKRHGISQEEFDAMSPEEKRKLLEQMRAEMEDEMKLKAEAKTKTKATTTDLFA